MKIVKKGVLHLVHTVLSQTCPPIYYFYDLLYFCSVNQIKTYDHLEPGHVGRSLQHVVSVPSRDGDECNCLGVVTNLLDVPGNLFLNFPKPGLKKNVKWMLIIVESNIKLSTAGWPPGSQKSKWGAFYKGGIWQKRGEGGVRRKKLFPGLHLIKYQYVTIFDECECVHLM